MIRRLLWLLNWRARQRNLRRRLGLLRAEIEAVLARHPEAGDQHGH